MNKMSISKPIPSEAASFDMKHKVALVSDQVGDERLYENADAPLTPERLARMKKIARTKTMRRAMGLTQEEFSERFRIPLGTLRDWEQGRTEPDAPARAYLQVIAKNPEMVKLALAS